MTGYRVHTAASDMDWRHRALCRDAEGDLFFPVGSTGPALLQIEAAKAVCRRCPVRSECLSWALDSGQDAGVWGGMSEDERNAILRGNRRIGDPQLAAAVRAVRVDQDIRTDRIRAMAAAGHSDTHIAWNLSGTWTPKQVGAARRAAGIPAGRHTRPRQSEALDGAA